MTDAINISVLDNQDTAFSLKDHLPLVLYFYPRDNTPGCTNEALAFNAALADFKSLGFELVGVSRDSVASHQKFIAKYDLQLTLLADTEEDLCQAFSVIKEKNMYGKKVMGIERSTFVLDANGSIVKEWRKVKVAGHVEDVLAFLNI